MEKSQFPFMWSIAQSGCFLVGLVSLGWVLFTSVSWHVIQPTAIIGVGLFFGLCLSLCCELLGDMFSALVACAGRIGTAFGREPANLKQS
jgi:hypothetical protein